MPPPSKLSNSSPPRSNGTAGVGTAVGGCGGFFVVCVVLQFKLRLCNCIGGERLAFMVRQRSAVILGSMLSVGFNVVPDAMRFDVAKLRGR